MRHPAASFVVPVYNKSPYLGVLFAPLADQMPRGSAEWIFVDDGSTDPSLAVLTDLRDRLDADLRSRFLILRMPRNLGPSCATNVGWRAASGRYVHFVDADDRLPRGATRLMMEVADREDADLVYGEYMPMSGERATVPEAPAYRTIDDPLAYVLTNKIAGIRFLTCLETVRRSGGADESVFVQDCTLPWRIAAKSRRMIDLDAAILEWRRTERQLSRNRPQELFSFVASVRVVLNENPDLPPRLVRMLHRRCLGRLARSWLRERRCGRWAAPGALSLGVSPGLVPRRLALAAIAAGQAAIARYHPLR